MHSFIGVEYKQRKWEIKNSFNLKLQILSKQTTDPTHLFHCQSHFNFLTPLLLCWAGQQ